MAEINEKREEIQEELDEKRKEIQVEMAIIICESENDEYSGDAAAIYYGYIGEKLLAYLHSQGVVIKVEREPLVNDKFWQMGKEGRNAWNKAIKDSKTAGYVAVEPLIGKDADILV